MASLMKQEQAATTNARSYTGYIPHDAPLALAASLALPYELPRTSEACLRRFGKAGRRVVIHIIPEELPA